MRHVMPYLELPSRESIRERIVDRDRFRPEPVSVRRVERRVLSEDGAGEARLGDAWEPFPAAVMEIFDALDDGCTFQQMFERAFEKAPRKLPGPFEDFMRRFLWDLHEKGFVAIPLEETPALFAERYERVREVGRGGMGVVHLCRDLHHEGRKVVVKHAWGWNKPIEVAEHTNRREAAVLASLDHPAYPRLLDTFEDRGILHIVRDYADGPTLGALAKPLRHGPRARRMRIALRIAEAVEHLHQRGYLHLDCKPGNFVILENDRPFNIDMGVARPSAPGSPGLKSRVGSPGFTAPEVRRALGATVLSDQYSIGCVMFHMALGSRPSRSWAPEGIAQKLEEKSVEEEERRVIVRMTGHRPEDRYPSLRVAMRAIAGLTS